MQHIDVDDLVTATGGTAPQVNQDPLGFPSGLGRPNPTSTGRPTDSPRGFPTNDVLINNPNGAKLE